LTRPVQVLTIQANETQTVNHDQGRASGS
jgi:hypothetical protein